MSDIKRRAFFGLVASSLSSGFLTAEGKGFLSRLIGQDGITADFIGGYHLHGDAVAWSFGTSLARVDRLVARIGGEERVFDASTGSHVSDIKALSMVEKSQELSFIQITNNKELSTPEIALKMLSLNTGEIQTLNVFDLKKVSPENGGYLGEDVLALGSGGCFFVDETLSLARWADGEKSIVSKSNSRQAFMDLVESADGAVFALFVDQKKGVVERVEFSTEGKELSRSEILRNPDMKWLEKFSADSASFVSLEKATNGLDRRLVWRQRGSNNVLSDIPFSADGLMYKDFKLREGGLLARAVKTKQVKGGVFDIVTQRVSDTILVVQKNPF